MSPNRAEKSINTILELVSSGSAGALMMRRFYDATLGALGSSGAGSSASTAGDRLAFKTRMKLARVCFAAHDWASLQGVVADMNAMLPRMTDKSVKLEVIALQLQVAAERGETKLVAQFLKMARGEAAGAVPSPSVSGVIQENEGKLAMSSRNWADARKSFQGAFYSYSEAGDVPRLKANLQYLLLTNMLSLANISPFDDTSAKAYERDSAIVVFAELTSTYLQRDFTKFISLLRKHVRALESDAFIKTYIAPLRDTVRAQAALALVTPYTRVKIDYVATELGIPFHEAESILAGLLLDGRLPADAALDQPAKMLVLSNKPSCALSERTPYTAPEALGGASGDSAAEKSATAASIRSEQVYTELKKVATRLKSLLGSIHEMAAAKQSEKMHRGRGRDFSSFDDRGRYGGGGDDHGGRFDGNFEGGFVGDGQTRDFRSRQGAEDRGGRDRYGGGFARGAR